MTPLEEEVKEKLEKILKEKLKVVSNREPFDIVDEHTSGAEIIIEVHSDIGLKENGQLTKKQENSLLGKWHKLERKEDVSKKYLIFTDPQMFSAFKRLRYNDRALQDESIKLGLINYPVYNNSKAQITKICSDETLTNAAIISLLKFGLLEFEKLPQYIQDNILADLIKKNRLSGQDGLAEKVKNK